MQAEAMPIAAILAQLRAKGNEKTRLLYSKHGNAFDRTLGVSMADLKLVAKSLKGQQDTALDLYATRLLEPMYLAGIVAHGSRMTTQQLQTWVESAAGMQMVSEHTVAWVTVENPEAWILAKEWIRSDQEHIAASGWSTLSGLVTTQPDSALDLPALAALLDQVVHSLGRHPDAIPNRVRMTSNSFVIAVGSYVTPLLSQAKAAASSLGRVFVDVGDTACQVPLASSYIEKMEALGKQGQKRKTIRC